MPTVETMTDDTNKAKRWRPSFSIRTLAIVVTLVCCYAACWGPTKKWANDGAGHHASLGGSSGSGVVWSVRNETAVAPLIVQVDLLMAHDNSNRLTPRRASYFWLFGYVAKLPWEREVEWDARIHHEGRSLAPQD
jgi:hypothetical protein